jgi:hypothetical protein
MVSSRDRSSQCRDSLSAIAGTPPPAFLFPNQQCQRPIRFPEPTVQCPAAARSGGSNRSEFYVNRLFRSFFRTARKTGLRVRKKPFGRSERGFYPLQIPCQPVLFKVFFAPPDDPGLKCERNLPVARSGGSNRFSFYVNRPFRAFLAPSGRPDFRAQKSPWAAEGLPSSVRCDSVEGVEHIQTTGPWQELSFFPRPGNDVCSKRSRLLPSEPGHCKPIRQLNDVSLLRPGVPGRRGPAKLGLPGL